MGCHFLLEGSSRPRDQTHVSCTGRRFFTTAPPRKPYTPVKNKKFKRKNPVLSSPRFFSYQVNKRERIVVRFSVSRACGLRSFPMTLLLFFFPNDFKRSLPTKYLKASSPSPKDSLHRYRTFFSNLTRKVNKMALHMTLGTIFSLCIQ